MSRAGGAGKSTCKGPQFSRVSASWAGAVKVPKFPELRPTYDAAEAGRVVARCDLASFWNVHSGYETKRLPLPSMSCVCYATVVGYAENWVECMCLWQPSCTPASHTVGLKDTKHPSTLVENFERVGSHSGLSDYKLI